MLEVFVKKVALIVYCVLVAVFIVPELSYAYIDPGTGSLILQCLAAAAFTMLAFWRGLRRKIKDFFSKKEDGQN